MTITKDVADVTVYLADQYVADTAGGFVGQVLARVAQDRRSSAAVSVLAMQLSLVAAETAVDGLLCDIDRFSEIPTGHELCCDGECECALQACTYVHAKCEACQDRPGERLDEAMQDLLSLVDERILGYIQYLITGDKAAA